MIAVEAGQRAGCGGRVSKGSATRSYACGVVALRPCREHCGRPAGMTPILVGISNQYGKFAVWGHGMAYIEFSDVMKIYGSGGSEVHALDLSLIHI